jgi:2-iminoacetate synthase ThiH
VGGDEFAVMVHCPGGTCDVGRLADALIGELAKPILVADQSIRIATSVGAVIPNAGRTPEMSQYPKTDAVTYLRTLALARVVLDNVPNLQSSWVTMGHKVGQIALRFGANDYGSLMMEENVVSAAGTTYRTTLEEIDRIIRDAGYRPRPRRQDYSPIEEDVAA